MKGKPLHFIGSLAGGAVFGKLLGIVRELEMARMLGAGLVADSLRGALTAVLLPINPLQGEIMTAGMIPLLREWHDHEDGRKLTSALLFAFLLLGLVVMTAVIFLAAPWVGLLVAGFSPEAHDLTVRLTRVMALAIPASVSTAAMSGVEISHGRARITTWRMALQNVGIILGILIMALTGYTEAIAWGFAIAFNMIAVYGAITLDRDGLISIVGLRPAVVMRATKLFIARARSLIALPFLEQGNLLVERMMASAATVGTLACLDYARTLTECALFLISQPIGYVVLAWKVEAGSDLRQRVSGIVSPLLALCVPASIFLVCFSTDLVRVIFERGRFGAEAVAITADALTGIGSGLWATTIGWILIRLLNAGNRNTAAATIISVGWVSSACANLILAPRFGALGLGLSESLRGVVLLFGASYALGFLAPLLRHLLPALGIAAFLIAVSLGALVEIPSLFPRLLASIAVFAFVTLSWVYVSVPKSMRDRLSSAKLFRRGVRQGT